MKGETRTSVQPELCCRWAQSFPKCLSLQTWLSAELEMLNCGPAEDNETR